MRLPRAWSPFLLLLLAPAPAGGQQVVTSARPDRVAVTLYRDPGRSPGDNMDARWLNGFALISETRQVTLPAGEAQLRFEGVAGGIVPQSAIITGLPDGIVERNRDAYLLSPESLLDRSLGRRVLLRRTSAATGAVTEQEAVIRTGADGAVVLQTAAGFEALRCTGLPERLIYDGVPQGLSARPTLSVRTRSSRPVTATVTLAYLASGFDWKANYVARLAADGAHIDLFAWLVLASGDETSFANAETQAVAGRLNRQAVPRDPPIQRPLQLRCWPRATTSDIPLEDLERGERPNLLAVSPVTVVNSQEIRLRGATQTEDLINSLPQVFARQEALGDLKLYRIPEPVTVAAQSVKQVAFLERSNVPVEVVHRRTIAPGDGDSEAAAIFLLTSNREDQQLGIPLPAGRLQLFRNEGDRSLLLGEGDVADKAVGEEVEVEIGDAPGVNSSIAALSTRRLDYQLTVTNDQSYPVRFEAVFRVPAANIRLRDAVLGRRNGLPAWTVAVPPNGSATLRYRLLPRGRG